MKYLGIMNGWKETPAEYTRHLAECGTEHEYTRCYWSMSMMTMVSASVARQKNAKRCESAMT